MKLRKAEREKLKQLVTDSILTRLTTEETIKYIAKDLGVTFKPNYIKKVKQWLRQDMQLNFAQLRQDKYAYINEYLQRINEVKNLQRHSWAIYGLTKDDHVRVKCMTELHSLTLSLVNLYDLLPAITERSFYNAAPYNPSPTPETMDSGETETEGSGPVVSTTSE